MRHRNCKWLLQGCSRPCFLICSSNAAAMFICVSRTAFRAAISGNCVIAVFKWAAFAVRSLCKHGRKCKGTENFEPTVVTSLTPLRLVGMDEVRLLPRRNIWNQDHRTSLAA